MSRRNKRTPGGGNRKKRPDRDAVIVADTLGAELAPQGRAAEQPEQADMPGGNIPVSAEQANESIDADELAAIQPAMPVERELPQAGPGFGQRLASARERAGLTRAEVAGRLKLPLQLIARLEQDDYTGLTQAVFLRGYLTAYARLLGLPEADAIAAADEHAEAVPLVATGTVPHSRYLLNRYSVSATYMILTAIIVVPAVWLATHGGLERNLMRTAPLDPPAIVADTHVALAPDATSRAATSAPAASVVTPLPLAAPAEAEVSPLLASMAPFATPRSAEPAVASPGPAATPASGNGSHLIELALSEQSWVEITAPDGRRLEYGMLAANSTHAYRSDGPVLVRLGNAQGARLSSDGKPVDLTDFQRGNVAHVKLFGDGAAPIRPEQ